MEFDPNQLEIQLLDYIFSKVFVQSAPDKADAETELEQDVKVAVQEHKTDPDRFMLTLVNTFRGINGEKLAGYEGDIHVRGVFKVTPECAKRLGTKRTYIKAAELLVPALREMVASLTCRGQWPRLMLPLVDLEQVFKDKEFSFNSAGNKEMS